jgi:hypothetical protein
MQLSIKFQPKLITSQEEKSMHQWQNDSSTFLIRMGVRSLPVDYAVESIAYEFD